MSATNCNEAQNLAQTLAMELKQPIEIASNPGLSVKRVALPPGWALQQIDEELLMNEPRRKRGIVALHDGESFVEYVKRHGSLTDSTVWCEADYKAGKIKFTGILNDHGESPEEAAWRDHRAVFAPEFSEEWVRWTEQHKKPFNQQDFAAFIEDNLKDIASVEGSPTGAQMLEMALSFEANQDMRFKSAMRLQNGGVQMSFVQDDDANTLQKMQAFDRFALGIQVFWNGDAYQLHARLRYRVREGKLTFWFELIRKDKVLEAATQTLIKQIREQTGNAFFFGEPFAK